MLKNKTIAVVIPAYNEEVSLPNVLESISIHTPSNLSYEVIVADNGSVDNTVSVARKFGAITTVYCTATVAGLRNRAVQHSQGRMLVFLDADILLTELWGQNIQEVRQSLSNNPLQVTGSRCGIPSEAGWIERFWFKPLLSKKTKYINILC